MEIITRAARLQAVTSKYTEESQPIGFVPTMGALHEGHLSLVREARRMSDAVIVSIFANPAQFESVSDFERYPRDLARDADLLSPIGVDYVFAPPVEEIYPKGFSTWIEVRELSERLEGLSRPNYFRGASTALTILLNLIHPKFVFMGQKEAQHTVIAKKLVRELHLPVEVVVMPIVRESDGLALSTTNLDLTPDGRRAAPVLHRALRVVEQMFDEGERSASKLSKAIRKEIGRELEARLDYVEITDSERLETIDELDNQVALVSVAAFFGPARLSDNIILNDQKFKNTTGRLKLG
jgi:pantoate--beta-alanine ligase